MEIKLKNVSYNNLKNVNLTFKENEIMAIIGKNNAGKTTLLDIIYGLAAINSGEVKIGKKIVSNNLNKKKLSEIRKDISYLIEDYNEQLFNINILEDIKYNTGEISEERLNELLKLFYLDKNILSKNHTELSSGEKKKILLISIFLKNSKVILLDNPNSGLDYRSVQNLIKILRKEKRNGKIIILTSHDSQFLLQAIDKVTVIDSNNIFTDDKYNVFTNYNLMKRLNIEIPKVLDFELIVKDIKNIKLGYRDNISDLIKDVYRNAR